jgi:hypothetical protein
VNIAVKGVCATQIVLALPSARRLWWRCELCVVVCEESRSRCGGWQNAAGEIIDSAGKRRRAAGFLAI